ncbi:MAG TPA: hypothetical protein VFZ42_10795 [Chitinophagaceae bacterium]
MKKQVLTLCALFLFFTSFSQLKTTTICPAISVDLLAGKVNGMEPDFTQGQIKKALPCFTGEEAESKTAKCGGGIFYKDKDIYFYTARDYVEIGPSFKGKLSLPLMGASRSGLFKLLGNPSIKDVNWDAFTTAYGIMILYYSKAGKVNKIQFSSQSAETINLCE